MFCFSDALIERKISASRREGALLGTKLWAFRRLTHGRGAGTQYVDQIGTTIVDKRYEFGINSGIIVILQNVRL